LRGTLIRLSQKGNIAHAGQKNAGRIEKFAKRNPELSRADSAVNAIAINFPSVQLNAGFARHDYFEINFGDAIK
jgi:hypothetical protein